MQILGLLGMNFDAAVLFVTSHSLLFRLAFGTDYGHPIEGINQRNL